MWSASQRLFRRHGLQSEVIQHDLAAGAAGSLQPAECFQCVDFAEGAAASITSEHLLAKIAGIGPQPPLVHTPVGTKCSPARGTSNAHQRHNTRPFSPIGSWVRMARPPGIVRCVLISWSERGGAEDSLITPAPSIKTLRRNGTKAINVFDELPPSPFVQHLPDATQRLAGSFLIFDQRKTDVAIAMLTETYPWTHSHLGIRQQFS